MKRVLPYVLGLVFLATGMNAAPVKKNNSGPMNASASRPYQVGRASWYGKYFDGRETASGEPYDMYQLTAAHRDLPLGTLVRVTNLNNGESVVVRINDRGPWLRNRIIDLSYAAARVLRIRHKGIERVRLDVIPNPEGTLVASTLVSLDD